MIPNTDLLFDEDHLQDVALRVGSLITADAEIKRHDQPLTVVGVLDGALFWMADLLRAMPVGTRYGFVRAKSYVGEQVTKLHTKTLVDPALIKGRHVIVAEDIVDTGETIRAIRVLLLSLGAESIRVAAMIDKPGRRLPENVNIEPTWIGMTVEPDTFVVGHGLDYTDGDGRNLRGVFKVRR